MKHFGGLFGFFLMTWGCIHATHLLFSIANSCGKCVVLLQPIVWKGRSHLSSIPRCGSGTRLTTVLLLRVKQLLSSKITTIITRNPSKMSKKGSGFKYVIRQNANRFCALCELHRKKKKNHPQAQNPPQKKPKNPPYQKKEKKFFKQFPLSLQTQTQNRWEISPAQFTLDQGILTVHRITMRGVSIAYMKKLPDLCI